VAFDRELLSRGIHTTSFDASAAHLAVRLGKPPSSAGQRRQIWAVQGSTGLP
jgi:hypothetical protein